MVRRLLAPIRKYLEWCAEDRGKGKGPPVRWRDCVPTQISAERETPRMRLTISAIRHGVKRDLPVVFGAERLTSYAGLELVTRYCRGIQPSVGGPRVLATLATSIQRGA